MKYTPDRLAFRFDEQDSDDNYLRLEEDELNQEEFRL
jgi:hypothetical protein